MADPLQGRVAAITGGAGGIGQAIAEALLQRGARVAVLDQHPAEQATISVATDVTDPDAMEQALRRVAIELGPLDHLVVAAGVASEHTLVELDPQQWRTVLDVSLTGTYLALRAAVPGMQQRGRGSVVVFSSGYATTGYRYGGHYAAAKAGVEALLKSVALEAGRDGVRVNGVAPGPVFTDFLGHIPDQVRWRADREARIPLGRIADPADLVGPVLFLLGPDSGYVTGQVLHVNGGLLMP